MYKIFTCLAVAAVFSFAGCDVDVNNSESPAESRMDRREERRENIKDAADGVDVEVGNGGVKVEVDEE